MSRIACIAPQAQIVHGGLERYVQRLAQLLVANGHDVTVVTIDTYQGKQYTDQTIDGIHYRRIPVLFDVTQRLKIWPGLYLFLKKEKFDIVQCFLHSQSAFFISFAAAKLSGSKMYVTTYGASAREADYSGIQKLILSFFDLLAVPLLRRSDMVFCRGIPLSKQFVKQMNIPERRCADSVSAIEQRYFTYINHKTKRTPHSILFNGRLHPHKGPQHIVEAVANLMLKYPDIRLWITGPDHGLRKDLEQLIIQKQASQNITILGVVPEDQLISLMDQASCFVLSSVFEGLSQAMLKAIARKTPVIATSIPSAQEILGKHYPLLYPYGNIPILMKKIDMVFTHWQTYHKTMTTLIPKLKPLIYEIEMPHLLKYYV